jgi:hypothetical protein
MKADDNVFSYSAATRVYPGITARDYIAIQVVTGLSANPELTQRGFNELADMAYKQADEMIKRSEK